MSTIAFLGTGTMGLPMARNLMRAVAERLERAERAGHGDEDMAATYWATAPEPGSRA